MGKLVPFVPKQDAAALESALERAGQMFQRRLKAREELPRVLAALIAAGQQEVAVQAMLDWGRNAADPVDLLEACEQAAAITGVRLEWRSGEP